MANIVTAREVAEYLKLTESTVYKLASEGEIPGFKIGKSWRFDMDEILKMIKEAKGNRTKADRKREKTEPVDSGPIEDRGLKTED